MVREKLSANEVVERGKRFYEDRLRAEMEREHLGDFLVVDVHSGDYEVARKDVDAALQILSRRPDASLFGIRIGEDVAYRFGLGQVSSR